MITAIIPIISGILSIVNKNVEDKDKRNEIVAAIQQSEIKLIELFVGTKTTPWVDAFVKIVYVLAYTADRVWRPLGSFLLVLFVAYMRVRGIPLDPSLELLLSSTFPGWMVSRHIAKQTQIQNQSNSQNNSSLNGNIKPR